MARRSWAEALGEGAIRAAHAFVKSAKNGKFGNEEVWRILLNGMKVVTHLYSTLSFCVSWPASLDAFREVAALLAVDPVTESKLPCFFASWDLDSRVNVALLAPIAVVVGVFLLFFIRYLCCGRWRGDRKAHV